MTNEERCRALDAARQEIHNRIGNCLSSCHHSCADNVRALIAKVLIDLWDGRTPNPPTPEALKRACCQGGAGGYAEAITMYYGFPQEGQRR